MVLNGVGLSNRQLYLAPQFFANKPVEHLLGPGITDELRECRLAEAQPVLFARPQYHQAVCWHREMSTEDLWDQG